MNLPRRTRDYQDLDFQQECALRSSSSSASNEVAATPVKEEILPGIAHTLRQQKRCFWIRLGLLLATVVAIATTLTVVHVTGTLGSNLRANTDDSRGVDQDAAAFNDQTTTSTNTESGPGSIPTVAPVELPIAGEVSNEN